MTVNVLYFALARDHAGCGSESLELAAPARVADALEVVRGRHPKLEALWLHLAVAVDGQLVGHDAPLRDGAELALLPPVSGG
jgi:molybdopterin converting factor small subunit